MSIRLNPGVMLAGLRKGMNVRLLKLGAILSAVKSLFRSRDSFAERSAGHIRIRTHSHRVHHQNRKLERQNVRYARMHNRKGSHV